MERQVWHHGAQASTKTNLPAELARENAPAMSSSAKFGPRGVVAAVPAGDESDDVEAAVDAGWEASPDSERQPKSPDAARTTSDGIR
jgi:hypothetical protein